MKDPTSAGCVMGKEKAESIASLRRGTEAIWLGDALGLGKPKGLKLDAEKLRYDLVDDGAEAEFVAVLTFGAIKYDPGNWVHVEDGLNRYFSAVRRHLRAFRRGETFDEETGLHHLAAAECNVHFMLGIAMRQDPEISRSFAARFKASFAKAHELRAARKKRTKDDE